MSEQANLGLATTEELILELAARVNIARVLGEQWPQYKTVDNPPLQGHVVNTSQAHEHIYPDEWDYSFSPAGSKTCKILGCSQKIYD